jgi:hypothetical protein
LKAISSDSASKTAFAMSESQIPLLRASELRI